MTSMDRIIRKGARRLALARFVRALTLALTVGVLVLLALRVAEKGFATGAPDWQWAWGIVLGGAIVGAGLWVWITRPDGPSIARLLDERCGLKATLGTAAWARADEQQDAWHAAAIDEGERAATNIVPRAAIPITLPRYWAAPLLVAMLTLGGHWMPQQDLTTIFDQETAEEKLANEEEDRQLIEVKDAVEESKRDTDAALKELNDETLNELLDQAKQEIDKPQSAEELQRNEMRRLTGLKDRLDELERTGEAAQAKALKELTAQLRRPEGETSPITKMAEAMKAGNMSEALAQLETLKQKLESSEGLTKEQKEALAKQLQQLADQLDKAAQAQQNALAQIAKQAGLPQNLANNPQALQQAIQNAKNLTPQQKQQLQQQLQNAQNASSQCKNCAGGMNQLAQAMQQGQGQGQAMQNMQNQLSQMEMMQQQLNQLGAAQASIAQQMQNMGQCNGGAPNQLPQWAQKRRVSGPGSQGQGGGKGGQKAGSTGTGGNENPESHADQTQLAQQKVNTNADPNGPMIGSMVSEGGQQVRGESVATFREAAQAAGEAASDAIDDRLVPKEYEEVVKKYFGGLEEEADKASNEENDKGS